MGMFDRLKKKKEDYEIEESENVYAPSDDSVAGEEEGNVASASENEFVYGVEKFFEEPDSNDLLITGKLKGVLQIGDLIYFTNPGDDKDLDSHVGVVKAISIKGTPIDKASNSHGVTLRIADGKELNIHSSTVGYSSRTQEPGIRLMYTSRLGDVYVVEKNLNLTEEDIASLSVTDLQEIWRLFIIYHTQMVHGESEAQVKVNKRKLDALVQTLAEKILESDSIYCLYDQKTGEPHFFSSAVNCEDGSYVCTPPMIRICTECYRSSWEKTMPEGMELRKIEIGEDGKGVYRFFWEAFYLDGAYGVQIINPNTAADRSVIVPDPSDPDAPESEMPLANPDLVRWMLLIGQMGAPKTEEARKTFSLYYKFESQELVKANLLIPIRESEPDEKPDGTGRLTLEGGQVLKFPVLKGKNDRTAVRMFTDWKRLRKAYGDEWDGLAQPVGCMIESMDCAINAAGKSAAGCYVSKGAYDRMAEKYGQG